MRQRKTTRYLVNWNKSYLWIALRGWKRLYIPKGRDENTSLFKKKAGCCYPCINKIRQVEKVFLCGFKICGDFAEKFNKPPPLIAYSPFVSFFFPLFFLFVRFKIKDSLFRVRWSKFFFYHFFGITRKVDIFFSGGILAPEIL